MPYVMTAACKGSVKGECLYYEGGGGEMGVVGPGRRLCAMTGHRKSFLPSATVFLSHETPTAVGKLRVFPVCTGLTKALLVFSLQDCSVSGSDAAVLRITLVTES